MLSARLYTSIIALCRIGTGIAFGILIATVLTAAFCLVLLSPAWMFVSIGELQTSPALGVRMDFIHVTVFILLALLALFAVLRMIRVITGASDGKPEDTTKDFP